MDRGVRHRPCPRDPLFGENELRPSPKRGGVLRCLRGQAAALAIVLSSAVPYAAEGDAARGERVFQRCYACHSVDPSETASLQGPPLAHIIGRPAAAIAGFDYSGAMLMKGAAGLVWDAATLDSYLADPDGFVPGTLMTVPPVRDEQERADIIAYLARSGRFRPRAPGHKARAAGFVWHCRRRPPDGNADRSSATSI